MTSGHPLSEALVGSWELLSRHTQAPDGEITPRPDSVIALVVYDRGGNFTAQFMDRERSPEMADEAPAGANNSRTIGGYDAYFGRYVVDDSRGSVTQTIVGSLAPENVGQVLSREMSVDGDQLTIRVPTTNPAGEPVVLTLLWRRVG